MPRQSSRIKESLTGNASTISRSRQGKSEGSHTTITRNGIDHSDGTKPALRLTFKMPSSRLREATSARADSEDAAPPARSTRNKQRKSYALASDSDEEDDLDEEDEEEEETEMSEPSNEEEEEEEEAEHGQTGVASRGDLAEEADEEIMEKSDANADEEGDIDMDDDDADDGLPLGAPSAAPAPVLKLRGPAAMQQPKVTVTPARDNKLKSVEMKEMEMDDEDEELSELGSDDQDPEEPEEYPGVDVEGDEDVDEMDEGDDSRSPEADVSRASTPDISKMTKRQRSRLDQVMGGDFLQLPMGVYLFYLRICHLLLNAKPLQISHQNITSPSHFFHNKAKKKKKKNSQLTNAKPEPQIKKHLTAEEHAMRRAEMARRRKNLSEKRNEEEKADTINRLLKKQAPKRRGKISQAEIAAQDRGDDEDEDVGEAAAAAAAAREEEVRPANPVFVRWVSNREGCRVGVPSEWLGTPVGRVFGEVGGNSGKMVEEVKG